MTEQNKKRPRDEVENQSPDKRPKTELDRALVKAVLSIRVVRDINDEKANRLIEEQVTQLLKNKASSNAISSSRFPVLYHAMLSGNVVVTIALLAEKADVNVNTLFGKYLDIAIKRSFPTMAYLLVRAGITLPAPASPELNTLLERISDPTIKNIILWGVAKKQEISVLAGMHPRTGSRSLLAQIARHSTLFDRQVLRTLLLSTQAQKKHANILSSLLMTAVYNSNITEARWLLEEKASSNSSEVQELGRPGDQVFIPALMRALGLRDLSSGPQPVNINMVKLLLKAKANPNLGRQSLSSLNPELNTLIPPVFYADNMEALNLLLEYKADVNAISEEPGLRKSLLMDILRKGAAVNDYQFANILLDKRANVDIDGLTNTTLITAIFPMANRVGLDPFLSVGDEWEDDDAVKYRGMYAMAYQQTPEKIAVIEKIIDCKADVNCRQSITKATPLMYAAVLGDFDVVRKLLDNNARVFDIHNENKKTALDYAREQGHHHIVGLLETAIKIQRQKREAKAAPSAAPASQFFGSTSATATTAGVLPVAALREATPDVLVSSPGTSPT